MPPGNETQDHSRPGFEAVGKRKNFRKSEIETYSPDSLAQTKNVGKRPIWNLGRVKRKLRRGEREEGES